MNSYSRYDLKKRKFFRFIAGGVLFLFLATIYFVFKSTRDSEKRFGKVEKDSFTQKVILSGALEPLALSVISPGYDGFVKKIFVKVGQLVKSGDPVVTIVQSLSGSDESFPIRSPINGKVVQVLKSEGQFVRYTDIRDALVRIDNHQKFFVNGVVPEVDLSRVKIGQKVIIRVTAVPAKAYHGVVKEIAEAAVMKDLQWGGAAKSLAEFIVKIEVTNIDSDLKSGMSAICDIITEEKTDVLVLGHEFIKQIGEKYFVIKRGGSNQEVKIGLQNESSVEIVEGLTEGEEVQQIDFLQSQTSSQSSNQLIQGEKMPMMNSK